MNKFLILTRVLLKNGGNPYASSKSAANGRNRRTVNLLVLALCLLPFLYATTTGMYAAYGALGQIGLEGLVLAMLAAVTCVAMVLFGVLYVISVYYFVDDTIPLLTMPLRAEQILSAKFIVVLLYQYFLEAFILLPCIVAYALRIHTAAFIAESLIVLLVLPVIPTVICSLIGIVLMAFGRFFRNKDRVKVITGLLSIALAFGVNFVIQNTSQGLSSGTAAQALLSRRDLIDRATMIFPSSRLVEGALMAGFRPSGLLQLALFLLVSAAAYGLFLLAGRGLYFTGVVGLSQSGGSGRSYSTAQLHKLSARRTLLLSYALKEWRMLYRTPAYFLNCVLSGVLFPPLMIVIFGFSSLKASLPANGLVLTAGTALLCFFCIFNLCSPTAVSREGKDFQISRYIPVPYRTQVMGKLLPGLGMSWLSMVEVALISPFILRIPVPALLGILIGGVVMVTGINMIGLIVDIHFPKLDWDDETAAVKRNLNFLSELIGVVVLFGAIIALTVFLQLGMLSAFILLLAVGAGLDIGLYYMLVTEGVRAYAGRRRLPARMEGVAR